MHEDQQLKSKRQRAITARERERRAWELYAAGRTQTEIATELAVTHQAVSKMIARVEQRVIDENRGRVMSQKARQSARLERLYALCIEGYERSQRDATKRTVKHLPAVQKDAQGQPMPRQISTISTEARPGDPRFLDQARAALADLRRLWGLDAPTKLQHQQIEVDRPLADADTDDLQREYRELLEEARALGLDPDHVH